MPRLRISQTVRGLLLAGVTALAQAQPQADEAMLAPWISWAEDVFKAPPAGSLEPELQLAAEQMERLAAERLRVQAPRWLAELRARHGEALAAPRLSQYLGQRMFNEIGIWHLQPLSPELTEAWIVATTDPRVCPMQSGRSWFSRQAHRWALLPAASRAAALENERHALARLGEPVELPARPVPGALEAATAMVERVRRQQAQPASPMPPVVARRILAEEPELEAANTVVRCALNQWWLREQLVHAGADRAARAAALQAFRFDWSPDVHDFNGKRSSQPAVAGQASEEDYPALARQQEITATVTVRVALDPSGRVMQAQVIERQVRVPGVEGRPLVYETALDAAALRRARGMKHAAPANEAAARRTLAMVFKLE